MRTKQQAWYNTGIGEYARGKLLRRRPDQAVLVAVRSSFPDAGTKLASIQWYRNAARREGHPVPTNREARAEWPERREEALREIGRDAFDNQTAKDAADRQ